jgi:hypothetical protein
MSIVIQENSKDPIYTRWGDINRPSEKIVFLILYLQEQVHNDTELNKTDMEIINIQNRLAMNDSFDIYKLCEIFSFSKKRMEQRLNKIEKKLTIEYLRTNL